VLFYPGVYEGQSLRLFGILEDKPYYTCHIRDFG